MPRQPRLELPGVPMYVVQTGVNRCAIFLDDEDRHHYSLLLRVACERFAVRVHAFVLMRKKGTEVIKRARRTGPRGDF